MTLFNDGAMDAYCTRIGRYRKLTSCEERFLGRAIQSGSDKALQLLVQANLKFVVAVCHNYANRGMPLGDLINEGNLGLIRAARRFDGGLDFRFISYAVWWIRQSILNALAGQERIVNLPTGRIEAIRRINQATRKLEQKSGRRPSVEELAEDTGYGVEKVLECRLVTAVPLSISRNPETQGADSGGVEFEDKGAERPDRTSSLHLAGRRVKGMLSGLRERERTVLMLYFGVGYETEHSLEQIGGLLNLTKESIRQTKVKALEKLKRSAKSASLISGTDPAMAMAMGALPKGFA